MLSNYHNQRDHNYTPKKSRIQSYMKGDLKEHNIFFNSHFGFYFNRKKEYRIKSENIITVCVVNLMQRCILTLKISNNFVGVSVRIFADHSRSPHYP